MGSKRVSINNPDGNVKGKTNDIVKNDKKVASNSDKVKVMSGEGSPSVFRQCRHVFYGKKHEPAEIESLLVRPCDQAIKVCNAIICRGSQG